MTNAAAGQQPSAPGDGTVVLDGINDYLRTATYALSGAVTVAMRVKALAWTTGTYVFDGFTVNGGAMVQRGVTPAVDIYAGSFAATNTNLALNTWATVIVVFNGAGSVVSINGVETTGNPGAATMAGMVLGAAGNTAFNSKIQAAEVLVYSDAADVAKRAAIKTYLDTRVPPTVLAFTAYTAFGDSITVGFGATNPWTTLLAASPSVGITANYGISGAQIIDIGLNLYNQAPQPSLFLIGTNDQRTGGYGSNATKRAHWKQMLLGALSWAAMPTKTLGQASVNTSGVWSNVAPFGGATGVQSTTSGSQRTVTTNGDVAYIWTIIQDSQTGTWKVTEGGVTKATGTTAPNAAIVSSNVVTNYGVIATRISGLGAGPHTLVFETTNAGLVYFMGATGLADQVTFNKVYSGNVISPNATGLATFGVDETNILAYGTDHAATVATLAGDGMSVYQVDTHSVTYSYQADGLHPNDAGQQQLADKFKSTMGAL